MITATVDSSAGGCLLPQVFCRGLNPTLRCCADSDGSVPPRWGESIWIDSSADIRRFGRIYPFRQVLAPKRSAGGGWGASQQARPDSPPPDLILRIRRTPPKGGATFVETPSTARTCRPYRANRHPREERTGAHRQAGGVFLSSGRSHFEKARGGENDD